MLRLYKSGRNFQRSPEPVPRSESKVIKKRSLSNGSMQTTAATPSSSLSAACATAMSAGIPCGSSNEYGDDDETCCYNEEVFTWDRFGRQSMSEKRHAHLDAKNAVTNQKEREKSSNVQKGATRRKRRINRTGWDRTRKKSRASVTSSLDRVTSSTSCQPDCATRSSHGTGRVSAPGFHYETYSIFDWDSYLEEVGGRPAPD